MTIYIELLVRAALKNAATTALLLGFILPTTSVGIGDEPRMMRESHLKSIKHIIVIYQENWSFDSLYGQFPGADGYANSFDTLPQLDVKAAPAYSSLIYQTPSPLTGPARSIRSFLRWRGNLTLTSKSTLALPLDSLRLHDLHPGQCHHR